MEPERRRPILLATLVIVLAGVAYVMWPRTSAAPSSSSNAPAAVAAQARATTPVSGVPDVRLDVLEAERPQPVAGTRNPFRFKPKPPPPPPAETRSGAPAAAAPGPPPGPPPLPPIPLKVIGIVETPEHRKIAVLNDGRGTPIYGSEGQVVLGQFRILRIGVESIEMSYLDGRGRQTIRLTGA